LFIPANFDILLFFQSRITFLNEIGMNTYPTMKSTYENFHVSQLINDQFHFSKSKS
jgi:hypothetical protein